MNIISGTQLYKTHTTRVRICASIHYTCRVEDKTQNITIFQFVFGTFIYAYFF